MIIALQLQLSALINGTGAANVSLPRTVVAQYKETNVTVNLPKWNLNINKRRELIYYSYWYHILYSSSQSWIHEFISINLQGCM